MCLFCITLSPTCPLVALIYSISNLGMFGIDHFAAIINPPQVCILAVGGSITKIASKPVDFDQAVEKKQESSDSTAIRVPVTTTMTVTLVSDERAVDGDTAGRFLQQFKTMMENPHMLM